MNKTNTTGAGRNETPIFAVRLDRDVQAWIKRAAAKQRCRKSEFARRILVEAFNARHSK